MRSLLAIAVLVASASSVQAQCSSCNKIRLRPRAAQKSAPAAVQKASDAVQKGRPKRLRGVFRLRRH